MVGYYLGHRETADLDLFASNAAIDEGEVALLAAARDVGATVEHVQTAPDFRRRLVRRENQSVIVDLVSDSAPQGPQPKNRFGGVRVDPPEEILANKLCALFSRAELRDPLDVLVLERAGFRSQDT
ncbi:MAG: nucleotidyl transferase AbiEii/AbiGii toxin family protein, partial [Planctomycetes bacterium]|nr:nucleotidyl transferase AbiEii/AbiGii toxin family protein [Planctomycetota bacterium]